MHRQKLTLTAPLAGINRASSTPARASATAPPASALPLAVAAEPTAQAQAALDAHALHDVLGELVSVVQQIRTRDRQGLDEVARLSVELGIALAERLLHVEIAANRQRLDRIVVAALERMQTSREIAVRGHPDDLALLERQMADHPDLVRYRDLLILRREESVQRGQIKLEADELFVAWDTQRCLAELRTALLEETYTDDET